MDEQKIFDKIVNYLSKKEKLTPESSYLLLTKVRNHYWDIIDHPEEPEDEDDDMDEDMDDVDYDNDDDGEPKKPIIKKQRVKLRK